MSEDPAEQRLRKIADALGIPVEHLTDETPELFDGSGECLRLWQQITTAEGRRRALRCIQKVVEDQEK